MRKWMLCATLLLPSLGLACDYDRRSRCEQPIVDLSLALPEQLQIAFVKSKEVDSSIVDESGNRTLLLPRSAVSTKLPKRLRQTAYYWPLYENAIARKALPLIEAIDDAVWSVFLREAARRRGNTWPHSNCNAIDISKRLPCRVLLSDALGMRTPAVQMPMMMVARSQVRAG